MFAGVGGFVSRGGLVIGAQVECSQAYGLDYRSFQRRAVYVSFLSGLFLKHCHYYDFGGILPNITRTTAPSFRQV